MDPDTSKHISSECDANRDYLLATDYRINSYSPYQQFPFMRHSVVSKVHKLIQLLQKPKNGDIKNVNGLPKIFYSRAIQSPLVKRTGTVWDVLPICNGMSIGVEDEQIETFKAI